jgi:pSer/pThr/pTyr-binding forkhead associated (FHA) protein
VAKLSLEVIEGPDAGRRIELSRPVEIGRQDGLDLVLQDPLVSRRHARLNEAREGMIVEDLGSRNGTFVNGNEVVGPTLVTAGDQILIGVSVLQLRSADQVAERPSAVRAVPPGLAAPARTPDYLPADLAAGSGTPRQAAIADGGRQPAPGPGAAGGRQVEVPGLDPLLDVHTKRRAALAPLAMLAVVALAVMIWLATR